MINFISIVDDYISLISKIHTIRHLSYTYTCYALNCDYYTSDSDCYKTTLGIPVEYNIPGTGKV